MNTHEEILSITQSALNGEKIEVMVGEALWKPLEGLKFDWHKYQYRVRPKETKQIMDSYELRIFPGGGISIMLGGSQVICLGPENIDTLHAASQKARGIEDSDGIAIIQRALSEGGPIETIATRAYNGGFNACWKQMRPKSYEEPEYREPSIKQIRNWECSPTGSGEEYARLVYKAGWNDAMEAKQ